MNVIILKCFIFLRFASRLVVWDPDFDRGAVFTVFFAVMNGSTALGGALPHLSSIASARGAARHVLKVINRVSNLFVNY
jgi:hypothetical protein